MKKPGALMDPMANLSKNAAGLLLNGQSGILDTRSFGGRDMTELATADQNNSILEVA